MAHKSAEKILRDVAAYEDLVVVGGWYKHYKGAHYIVDSLTYLEETQDIGVIYYDAEEPRFSITRKAEVFLDVVTVDGQTVNRFQFTEQPAGLQEHE